MEKMRQGNLEYNKNKLYKTLDYWSRDILNFNFPEKDLRLVTPPYFEYDFWRKMFLRLYSIHSRNFIVWLPFLLKMCAICVPKLIANQAVTS